MNLFITSNFNKTQWTNWLILLPISFALGLYLFLSNPWLRTDLHSDSYTWFLDFSRTIFQPQSAYYAESILLPLLARIIGASNSLENYKLLCSFFTLSILPIVAIFAQNYFLKLWKTLLFIFIFGFSFQYFQYYILGFPDPLTILLLVLAVFQKKLKFLFLVLCGAMLSHYSMAVLGAIGLASMLYFSPIAQGGFNKKTAITVILAIITGKILLLSWYGIFHYQLVGRMSWALAKGYGFFLERYELNPMAFWLTPGLIFLGVYLLIVIYFFVCQRRGFAIASLFSITLSYLALFWTVDGLRVFSVIIAAPYAYLLAAFIVSLGHQCPSKNSQ